MESVPRLMKHREQPQWFKKTVISSSSFPIYLFDLISRDPPLMMNTCIENMCSNIANLDNYPAKMTNS